MTALDDALGEALVVLGPHQMTVNWRETDNGDISSNPDSISNLTTQLNGNLSIAHSLNDALPDPVTMSTGEDASGILSAGLLGREGLTIASSGQRAFDASAWNASGPTMSLACTFVNTVQRGDFVICMVMIDDSTASLVQNAVDPKYQWNFQGVISDAPYSIYIYSSNRYYPGRAPLTLSSDKNVSYISMTSAFWAVNPLGYPLGFKVSNVGLAAESASVTSHSVSSTLYNQGYQIGFWGNASGNGTWSSGGGLATTFNVSVVGMVFFTGTTALRDSGFNTLTATQATATAVAAMAVLSVEPIARPRLDARQYFSPLNPGSPIYGFDRDTASVMASIRVLTASGPVDTQVFKGQMQGVTVSGRAAELAAVSKTRIRLNRSVSLPVVGSYREGLTLDWLITWLMSRGSQFVGPAPSRYTRYWAPLHGSVHAHLDSPYGYNAVYNYHPAGPPGGPYGTKSPPYVDGPFSLGMFAQQTSTRIDEIVLNPGNNNLRLAPTQEFPHITEAGGPYLYDMMSVANSKGRICFWIRGDAATGAPSYVDAGENFLFFAQVSCTESHIGIMGYVKIGIDPVNRRAYIQMGSDAAGFTTVTYAASGLLPTDGAWHFYGFWWDLAAGTAKVYSTTESSSSAWLTNGNNATAQMPLTDDQGFRLGYQTDLYASSHLPIAEFTYDAGIPYSASIWDDQLTTVAPGKSVTIRPLRQKLVGIAEPTAVNAWDSLADIARASLSAYRVNELDNLEFLPPSYFGETAQMTSVAVQDTKKNAADLDVTIDPSKIRNDVTVVFQDSRIDTNPQPVLQYATSVDLQRGTTLVTFPLDVGCVELHGASTVTSTNYSILNLTATQINTPTLPTANHYVTINSASDGSGTVLSAVQVSASFVAVDALSVTIQFINRTIGVAYLVNNGSQVPFLQVMGYGFRQSDGYTTLSDSSSIVVRGDRSLETELSWIQDRSTAMEIAGQLLTRLARPRPEISLNVLGDPRRVPGQLITVLDAEGTGAVGSWRVLAVGHNAAGAEYTQDLTAVQVLPASVWDGLDGWDNGVWS